MSLAILQQKSEPFSRLIDRWLEITGGRLLAVDEAGELIIGDEQTLPEGWREALAQAPLDQAGPLTSPQGEPFLVAPLNVEGTLAGYLLAAGDAPAAWFKWSANALESLLSAEQSLQGMTDELISAWDQLELVCRVTQSLASTADLLAVLRSILTEVRRVLNAGNGFLVLEYEGDLKYVSVGANTTLSPRERQLYHRLQRAEGMILYNDIETVREFWPDAPADLVNLLGIHLPIADLAQAAIVLTHKDGRGFTAGDGKLLTAVVEQIAAIVTNTLLHQQILAQERVQRELEIAAEIQFSLLPRGLPQIPGIEFAVASLPATEVGGDFYDFIPLDEDRLGIVMGDVAGKGVPAAMFTSLVRTILRVEAGYGHSPQHVVAQTNQALMQDLQHAEMFVTTLVAYLDWHDLALVYANAGHTPGLWWRADRSLFEWLGSTSPPLGVKIADPGEDRVLKFSPGDFVLFYTDGITEALSPNDQLFGSERLQETLAAHAGSTADDLVQAVLSAVRTFRRDASRSDDLTLIAMRIKPSVVPESDQVTPALDAEAVEFSLPADLQSLDTISERVTQACRALPNLPTASAGDDFVYLVELAVSEICTNIIQHAYRMAGGEVRGRLTPLTAGIQVDLYDDGESFDPNAVPDPSYRAGPLKEGGYGLHIVRQIMDKVIYQAQTPNGNHWRLIKYTAPKN
jgi:serine phosphatase RsbU (regulator of sigma subunit)/anti-sigma regulatory factor (Ser/Thr protein kinase)